MSVVIPEGIKKKWSEEVKVLAAYSSVEFHEYENHYFIIAFEKGYLAAKTSSYELKENLRKRGNNLSKECVELQKEIQKRDDLLEEIPYIFPLGEYHLVEKYEEWLKQYEEMKR